MSCPSRPCRGPTLDRSKTFQASRSNATPIDQAQGALRGALLGDRLEACPDLGDVVADVVEPRERRERFEAEHALEERRRAVPDRAEIAVAPGLGDEAALEEPGDDAVDVDAADAGDLPPRARAEVRDDRERLESGVREALLDGAVEEPRARGGR